MDAEEFFKSIFDQDFLDEANEHYELLRFSGMVLNWIEREEMGVCLYLPSNKLMEVL